MCLLLASIKSHDSWTLKSKFKQNLLLLSRAPRIAYLMWLYSKTLAASCFSWSPYHGVSHPQAHKQLISLIGVIFKGFMCNNIFYIYCMFTPLRNVFKWEKNCCNSISITHTWCASACLNKCLKKASWIAWRITCLRNCHRKKSN